MRVLSGYDYDRARNVLRWPLREALVAYVEAERASALAMYRHEQSLYVVGGLKNAPGLPGILRTKDGDS